MTPPNWNEGKGWHPIGAPPDFNANMQWCGDNTTYCYTADFDGNGHTISNLYINRSITNNFDFNFVGLFGTAYNNTLRDVGLVNPYISIDFPAVKPGCGRQ